MGGGEAKRPPPPSPGDCPETQKPELGLLPTRSLGSAFGRKTRGGGVVGGRAVFPKWGSGGSREVMNIQIDRSRA